MTSQSFGALEFDALRQLLAERTQTPMGRRRALNLTPSIDRERVRRDLRRTSDAVQFLSRGGEFGLGGLCDPGPMLGLLKIQAASLAPMQILDLIRLIEAGQSLRRLFFGQGSQYPHLVELIRMLPDLQSLLRKLQGKILPDGQIDDRASPTLAEIRRDIQTLRARLHRRLEAILRRTPSAFIQDDLITIRNERYVIPIRVEHKGQVAGVVHAASSSGATVFIEPLETIELNNELVELREREEAEIARILAELSDHLRTDLAAIERLVELIAEIDLIGAKARLARDFNCCEPTLTERLELKLIDVRHILLEESLRRQHRSIVPISLHLDGEHTAMIISGPNAGGKTVALKTVGLCALMAQAGMHIPARHATLPVFHQVLADIGDQQSIVANLSTFTAHISNVRRMVEMLSLPALVVIDEVGTGTDPEEGAALAVAIVDAFKRRGAMVIATTHYQRLKMYAQLTPGVVNAAVEFDRERLEPTYRLIQGVAGASSGLDIAQRLGLPEEIVRRALHWFRAHDQEVVRYLNQLKVELDRQQALRRALEEDRRALVEKEQTLEREFARRERERQQQFERRLQQVVDDFSQQARALLDQLHERKAQLSLQRAIDRHVSRLKADLRKRIKRETGSSLGSSSPPEKIALAVGDAVRLLDIDKVGTVASLRGDEVVVEVGRLRFRTTRANVEPVTEKRTSSPTPLSERGVVVELTSRPPVRPEINVIGCTVQEALDRIDKFLDEATLASFREVRIIHGAGTGALRTAIRQMLASHPQVIEVRPGAAEAADVETVARLRESE